MFGRNKIAMVVAEFLGTFSLASVMLAMVGRTTFPFFSAAATGATFALMVLVIGTVSGAYLNPALSIALWTVRKLETTRMLVFIAAQMLGGLVAWRLNQYLLNAPLKSMADSKFLWRICISEALGAFILAFGLAASLYQNYKGLRHAVTAGLSLSLGIILATFASNGLLNPAVALGLRSWNTAYVAGPILGAIVGVNLYARLFVYPKGMASKVAKVTVSRNAPKVAKKTAKKPARKRG